MTLIVAPHLVGETHPLVSVHGVFNAIYVTGNAIGDAMFYGQGAGTLPTASAVGPISSKLQQCHTTKPVSNAGCH